MSKMGHTRNTSVTLGTRRRVWPLERRTGSQGDFAKGTHTQRLAIAKEVGDRAGEGGAYGNLGNAYRSLGVVDYARSDDRPFIVLTETKFSLRCIPVWIGTLLTGLGSKKTHVIMFSP